MASFFLYKYVKEWQWLKIKKYTNLFLQFNTITNYEHLLCIFDHFEFQNRLLENRQPGIFLKWVPKSCFIIDKVKSFSSANQESLHVRALMKYD